MQLLVVLCAAAAVVAFEAEEHKLCGDLGSQNALARFRDSFSRGGSVPLAEYTTLLQSAEPSTGDVAKSDKPRLIRTSELDALIEAYSLASFKTTDYPRDADSEAHLSALQPLLVWVGSDASVGTDGAYFTFGDLVALYGDLRRVVTCDSKDPSYCGLVDSDEVKKMSEERRIALRNIAAGKVLVTGNAVTSIIKALGLAEGPNHDGVRKGKNGDHDWFREMLGSKGSCTLAALYRL